MVAVNTKLLALARALKTDAAQRIIVLDATRDGAKVLLQTGEARRPAQPSSPPLPARPSPQAVARTIETQAGLRPAGPAFGEAARAYDQAASETGAQADPAADDARRATAAARGDATPAVVRAETPQHANAPAQGLAAAGGAVSRGRVEWTEREQRDGRGEAGKWSLKWWDPASSSGSADQAAGAAWRKRLVAAFAVILAGVAIAAML